ncbi:DNA-binding transcriptional regulator, LysR family [Nannocystis exedens]|uniref:DNA-binding transcriptional regulator, LysR family n=1 Tax=Nannocystis exedens TaxID=54 RepID=A0A1I2GQN2_9BACT|nr:LysR family transcriptional regulator [Nannocystis exedens]PCC68772.1 LysR family transcriptional regulator [Nannocystis exedens]SFF19925.1 DNA-binding transcriptional regulator, LysR family [Nannocystis exedens]
MESLLANLPTLMALVRHGSVSAAAAELGVPRSTVSRRLARLEQELGVVLAERTTRTLKLTDAARELGGESAALLTKLRTTAEAIVAEAGKVKGRLRIALAPGLGGPFIAPLIASFHRRHPDVVVELLVTERQPHLLDDQIDALAVTTLDPALPWSRRSLGRTPAIAVASPRYLRDRPALTDAAALDGHVVLWYGLNRGGTFTWPRLRGAPIPVRPAFVTNDLPTLREMALEGVGVAMLPMHLIVDELARGALVHVLPKQIGATIEFFALFVPERGKSPVLRALFDEVSRYSAKLAASANKA